jgi:hypothetical protein
MVTLVGSQIWWTWETEDVFRRVRDGKKHAMKDFAAKLTGQLSELTAKVGATPLACCCFVHQGMKCAVQGRFVRLVVTS